MKVSTWKVVSVLAVLAYGFFGIIHADNASSAALGNFLDVSGKIALGLTAIAGVFWFASSKPSNKL